MSHRRPATDPRAAVGYIRVSTAEQHLGPDAQRAAIEAWASREGVAIVAWHEDHVSGAAPVDQRPGLLAALSAVAELRAGVLVVAKRDRLARDVLTAALVEQLAARTGARIVSAADEGTSSDDPAAMLMRRMVDAFAEYERALIRARTRAALGVKRARGETIGHAPYGHRAVAGRLVPDVAEQAVIRQVHALRDAGLSQRGITAELARAGLVGRTGRAFAQPQVQRMANTALAV